MNKLIDLALALEEHDCGCHECDGEIKQANAEQERAARKHRWKEFDELALAYVLEIAERIEKIEKQLLAALGLPEYDDVVEAYLNDTTGTGVWTFTAARQKAYKLIVKQFLQEMTGESSLKSATISADMMPLTNALEYDAFGMSLKKYKSVYKKKLPPSIDPAYIDNVIINAGRDNRRLIKLTNEGIKRVKKKIVKENYREMVKRLLEKSKMKSSPTDTAKLLHRWWGGDLAHWDRLVKSEMSLAANEAYKEWSEKTLVLYNVWHAMPGCCPICSFFDGNKWLVNENPWPVTDTHPRCQCIIEPSWELKEGETTRDRWDRMTPYESPMSQDELRAWERWYGD